MNLKMKKLQLLHRKRGYSDVVVTTSSTKYRIPFESGMDYGKLYLSWKVPENMRGKIDKPSSSGVSCSVGAIAGYNDGTIVGCSNASNVFGSLENATVSVGGITGENGSTGVIQNCYNLACISIMGVKL